MKSDKEKTESFTTEEFDAAFAKARKSGAKTFMLGGNKYSTKTAEGELSKRRTKEKMEDRNASPLDRISDAFSGRRYPKTSRLNQREAQSRRQGKDYDDFVVENRDRPNMGLSRGARTRADALIKEKQADPRNASANPMVGQFQKGGKVKGYKSGGMAKGPMKKNMGGKVMAYKAGGGVKSRGTGKARKTNSCTIVRMKGS